jgi:succinyl-diaminopimelate desuccinylase
MIDALELAQALIRCRSVTPADDGAQAVLAAALESLGFAVHRLEQGSPPDGPIHNLFATIGEGAPHFAFAGHTDVVPVGDHTAWSVEPFDGTVAHGQLVGRGANDMKAAIAAFIAAAQKHVARGSPGTLSLIITGDEEGPATHGTADLLTWMALRGFEPDACLVGEPTSNQHRPARLGQCVDHRQRRAGACRLSGARRQSDHAAGGDIGRTQGQAAR